MDIAEITGASFTAVTVNVNGLVATKLPSLTVKTIFVVPKPSAVGFIVTVQFGAVPANTMLATGSSAVFEDVALMEVAQLSVESTSVIVNGIAAVIVSSFVV